MVWLRQILDVAQYTFYDATDYFTDEAHQKLPILDVLSFSLFECQNNLKNNCRRTGQAPFNNRPPKLIFNYF